MRDGTPLRRESGRPSSRHAVTSDRISRLLDRRHGQMSGQARHVVITYEIAVAGWVHRGRGVRRASPRRVSFARKMPAGQIATFTLGLVARCTLLVIWFLISSARAVVAQGTPPPDPRTAQPERPTVATHAYVVAPGIFELKGLPERLPDLPPSPEGRPCRIRGAAGDHRADFAMVTDGKEPDLLGSSSRFSTPSAAAMRKSYRKARPLAGTRQRKAPPSTVMAEASGPRLGRQYFPANARQIMYAARPFILETCGLERLDDAYFTQVLLPDYLAQHPGETADWDVVYDARGQLVEPHTGISLPLGTLQVRDYLRPRPPR